MDAATGSVITGEAHLAQSLGDLLSTPIGTRVGLRDYGSALAELIDAPLTALTRLRLFAATAVAIARWEPRLRLTKVTLAGAGDTLASGQAGLTLFGERTDLGTVAGTATLTVPLRLATA